LLDKKSALPTDSHIIRPLKLTFKRKFLYHRVSFYQSKAAAMPRSTPLNAIRVFVAAARHLSFKQAAAELCVTAGAVSRQIQLLEAHLGHALFERRFRAIALSQMGELYLAQVQPALAAIDGASERIQALTERAVLRVEATPTFAMYWLIPRLAAFQSQHPEIDIRLSTAVGLIERGKEVDLFIRRDPAHFNGLAAQRFMTEYAALVASPRLPALAELHNAADIAAAPRIVMRSRPDLWPQWLAAQQLDDRAGGKVLSFDNTILAIQATVEALGIAIIPRLFLDGQLGASLCQLPGTAPFASGAYYLLAAKARNQAAVQCFSDWLLASAGEQQSA
jgi:LysR family glycine cleavage system transcriptional activator